MQRPATVPADAFWDDGDREWVSAETDDAGRKHGLVRYFRPDGSLCCETEFVEDVPHGGFRRFHENGEVSREGNFERGQLHGSDTFTRSTGETSENFPQNVPEAAWRCEMIYDGGRVVGGRLYDEDGDVISSHGVAREEDEGSDDEEEQPSGPPERAAGIPEAATWDEDEERWSHGPRNELGERHGTWKSWGADGSLVAEGRWAEDWPLELKAYHEDGALASHETYQPGGVPIARVIHRGPDGTGFPEDIPDEVSTVEYAYDAHGYMTGFRFLGGRGRVVSETPLYNDSTGRVEQTRFPSLEAASKVWRDKGGAFKRALNAWLDVIYKEERENEEPEPEDERGDMERVAIEAIEQLNAKKRHDELRRMFPPAVEPLGEPFFAKYGRPIRSVLALSHGTFAVHVDRDVYFCDGPEITLEKDVLCVGASPDKRHVAIAFRDRVEVRAEWNGPPIARFAYPKSYGAAFQRAYPNLKTPALRDPRLLDIASIQVLPGGKRVILATGEGTWALSAGEQQLLFPDQENLEIYAAHVEGDELRLGMQFVHVGLDPRGTYVGCGGMYQRGIFAHLLVYAVGDKGLTLQATSGAQAFFPRRVCFHDRQPTIAYAATLYAAFSNMGHHMPQTTFRLTRDQIAQGGAIEAFDGGVRQGLGRVETIAPFGEGFLLGMHNGYLWHMSATENVTQLGYVHLGGAVTAIDLAPDGKALYVGGSTGMVVRLALSEARDPNLISDMKLTDERRWLFWKTFAPMVW